VDTWPPGEFCDDTYHVCVHGPNGFFRQFRGTANDPLLEIKLEPARARKVATGNVLVHLANRDNGRH